MCKLECNFKYYPIEIERSDLYGDNMIRIQHSEFPDIFIMHIPILNLIDFICQFGGLLGMWLGLSLFGIFDNIFKIITKIDYKRNIITFKNMIKRLINIKTHIKFNLTFSNRFARYRFKKRLDTVLAFIRKMNLMKLLFK